MNSSILSTFTPAAPSIVNSANLLHSTKTSNTPSINQIFHDTIPINGVCENVPAPNLNVILENSSKEEEKKTHEIGVSIIADDQIQSVQSSGKIKHHASSTALGNTPPIAAQAQKNRSSQQENFLKHDRHIISKMLDITKQLSDQITPEHSRELLQNLGRLAFDIKHDQNDPLCIRNQFGDYSDEKGLPRPMRYHPSRIPFQGLFYISKWIEKDTSYLDQTVLKNWIFQHRDEFILLDEKLTAAHLSTKVFDTQELIGIQQLGECANDLLHLDVVIEALDGFSSQAFDLNDISSRYAIARFYAILGETAKCLSSTITNCVELEHTFQKLGQCRDQVKLPFLMPKTAERISTAHEFLKSYGPTFCVFFKNIKNSIIAKLNGSTLRCTDTYRTWLQEKLILEIKNLPLSTIKNDIEKIKIDYKKAKKSEQTEFDAVENDVESDDEEEETNQESLLQESMESAVKLISGYQRICENHSLYKIKHQESANIDTSNVSAKQKKKNKKVLVEPKEKKICFDKYGEFYEKLHEKYPDLPIPQHESLMLCDVKIFSIQAAVPVKKPRLSNHKLLVKFTASVEEIYEQLAGIKPENSLKERLAHDQCVAFLGQLFIEINALHKLVLKEPTSTIWDQDFGQAIQIRQRRLMHNLVNYDSQIVQKFVENSIMPWRQNFIAFSVIAKTHEYNENDQHVIPSGLSEAQIPLSGPLNNVVGLSYTQLEQWTNAEKYFLRALKAYENSTEDMSACIMHNIADIYRVKGDWQKTTEWIQKAWEHRRANLAETHPYYVSTCIHLGMCYEKTERMEEALQCYQEAMSICIKHNLKQNAILKCLADYYADQSDYPRALSYYDQLLKISHDKESCLYLFQSMQTTAIECGQHEKALKHYHELKTLFQNNRAYFKSQLGTSDFLELEQAMIGPIYILNLMGKHNEALQLLNDAASLSTENLVIKLRILRDLKRYDEALILAESLREKGKSGLLKKENDLFNCDVFYAQVLCHLKRDAEALPILHELCRRAVDLESRKGNSVIQSILSPYNTLFEYYVLKEDYKAACACTKAAIVLINKITPSTLSYELFITLANFFRAHLLAGDLVSTKEQMATYLPFILLYLQQPHPQNIHLVFDEWIYLLIEHQCHDIAKKFLKALATTKNITSPPRSYLNLFLHLTSSFIASDKAMKGISILNLFLTKYCSDADKPLCSLRLAEILYQEKKPNFLCPVVNDYQKYWNENFSPFKNPTFQTLKSISNLSFLCMKFRADNDKFDKAVVFSQTCIRYACKIYTKLQEEKPVDKEKFENELFKQYLRLPMAIAEFIKFDYVNGFKTLLQLIKNKGSMKVSRNDIQTINAINMTFFGGELNIHHPAENSPHIEISVSVSWQNFLSAFNHFFKSYWKPGIKTPLIPLDMTPS